VAASPHPLRATRAVRAAQACDLDARAALASRFTGAWPMREGPTCTWTGVDGSSILSVCPAASINGTHALSQPDDVTCLDLGRWGPW